MSFELPYETLTPILGDTASYDPKTETTPDFMNKKFKELLENDKASAEQINVLSGNQNGLKFYTSLTQINSSFTISTSITDIYLSMKDNSIAMFLIGGTNTVYPAQFGQCIIYKSTTNRDSIEFTDATTGKKYIGTCHVNYTGGFSGWDQIVTASMLSTIDARLTDLETQLISTQNI